MATKTGKTGDGKAKSRTGKAPLSVRRTVAGHQARVSKRIRAAAQKAAAKAKKRIE